MISRSDEPGSNGKFYWNVGWADEQTFARTPATSQTGEPKRVPPPANDYGAELKRDPQGIHAGAAQPRAQENPAPAQRELSESQARPAAATPVTERELTDAEKKKRARMSEIRRIWHGLWESELEWQLGIVAKLKAEGRLVDFTVDGSSVNAACASQFIKFDRENLI